jgi:hypothetical protein
VSALASGAVHHLWRQMDEDERQRKWRLYGWFSGLMLCGSCVGAVSWATRMMGLVNAMIGNHQEPNITKAEVYSTFALTFSWRAAFSVFYPIEFLCLSAAELMVLDRMSNFAAPYECDRRKRWVAGGRIVMAVVLLGNAVGLAANIAAAVQFQNGVIAFSTASEFSSANNTKNADTYVSTGLAHIQLALSIGSVQSFCEVAVLLLIVAAFVVVGVLCARRIVSVFFLVSAASAAAAAGRALRLKIVGTTGFVFVAFLLRSVVSTMLAVAYQLSDSAKDCPNGVTDLCDASCFNVYTHMARWMAYTPEFQLTVILISSPLALLVALWGMTSSNRHSEVKKSSRQETSSIIRSSQRATSSAP